MGHPGILNNKRGFQVIKAVFEHPKISQSGLLDILKIELQKRGGFVDRNLNAELIKKYNLLKSTKGPGEKRLNHYEIDYEGIFKFMKNNFNLYDYSGELTNTLKESFEMYLHLINERCNPENITLFSLFEDYIKGMGFKSDLNKKTIFKFDKITACFLSGCLLYYTKEQNNKSFMAGFMSFPSSSQHSLQSS